MPGRIGTALSVVANAAQQTFDLAYSGASFGDNVAATGSITFDPTEVTGGSQDLATVTGLTLTVTGWATGNGTFTLADFDKVFITTGGPLDFHKAAGRTK